MRWVYKLEYKYGNKFGIPRLMLIVVIGMIASWLLAMSFPALDLLNMMTLTAEGLKRGEVWRLITFLFVPPLGSSYFWTVIRIGLWWMFGNSLEQIWGSFRFTLFYLLGVVGCWVAALAFGWSAYSYFPVGNDLLNTTLFLAYALMSPESTIRMYFIIPLKAKWVAVLYALFLVPGAINAFRFSAVLGLRYLALLALSLLGFWVMCGPGLVQSAQEALRIRKNRRQWRNGGGR